MIRTRFRTFRPQVQKFRTRFRKIRTHVQPTRTRARGVRTTVATTRPIAQCLRTLKPCRAAALALSVAPAGRVFDMKRFTA